MNTPSSVCTAVIGFEHADFNFVNDLVVRNAIVVKIVEKNFNIEFYAKILKLTI